MSTGTSTKQTPGIGIPLTLTVPLTLSRGVGEVSKFPVTRRHLLTLTGGGLAGGGIVDRTQSREIQETPDDADLDLEITSESQTIGQEDEFTIDITATNETENSHHFNIAHHIMGGCCVFFTLFLVTLR